MKEQKYYHNHVLPWIPVKGTDKDAIREEGLKTLGEGWIAHYQEGAEGTRYNLVFCPQEYPHLCIDVVYGDNKVWYLPYAARDTEGVYILDCSPMRPGRAYADLQECREDLEKAIDGLAKSLARIKAAMGGLALVKSKGETSCSQS